MAAVDMVTELMFLATAVITLGAGEWFLPRVDHVMPLETVLSFEHSATDRAVKQL